MYENLLYHPTKPRGCKETLSRVEFLIHRVVVIVIVFVTLSWVLFYLLVGSQVYLDGIKAILSTQTEEKDNELLERGMGWIGLPFMDFSKLS